jgi:DNA polymerase V
MSSTKPNPRNLFVLADCNNFYASCERVFDPKLIGKPVVVLSNNDGCIVARSKEAKALGIPMGAPLFEWKHLIERNRVAVRSSNYALYGDMSQRVMAALAHFSPEIEIYSIDEAFLTFPFDTPLQTLEQIRSKVLQWTGIPISLGIAPTKTLAKLANEMAKGTNNGVFSLVDPAIFTKVIAPLPVGEVWGIGHRTTNKLNGCGIWSIGDLVAADDLWIRKNFTVNLLRTVWELRGTSCLSLEEIAPAKKSIVCSRSFGKPLQEESAIAEALAAYTASAAEKVRQQQSVVSYLEVFLLTNVHSTKQAYYSNQRLITLPEPTSHTPTLLHFAKLALKSIYREGLVYKKVGVIFGGLVPENNYQRDLFVPHSPKKDALMAFLDKTNRQFGKKVLRFAAEGVEQEWMMRSDEKSPCYTTRWSDILKISI